jgi:hypothetical protein
MVGWLEGRKDGWKEGRKGGRKEGRKEGRKVYTVFVWCFASTDRLPKSVSSCSLTP